MLDSAHADFQAGCCSRRHCAGNFWEGGGEGTLSSTELVRDSDHSALRLMLMLPWGTSERKLSTAAACASSTLWVTTQGSLLESPSAHTRLSEHRPATPSP